MKAHLSHDTGAASAPNIEMLESRIAPATLTVTTINDSSDTLHDTGSLRDALALADANPATHDTIVFHIPVAQKVNGVFTITLNGTELTSKGNVTVDGPGTSQLVINGHSASRILDVNNGAATTDSPVTITGLSMVNGKASGNIGIGAFAQQNYGGAIYSAESLNINHVVISSSSAAAGGGVTVFGNTTALTKTKISGALFASNSTSTYGGGLDVANLTSLSISKSTFLQNVATANSGGAIFASVNATSTGMLITGCQISGNTASYGGGLYVTDSHVAATSKITISSTKITGNTSTDVGVEGGGGLYIKSGNAVITGSTISQNTAQYNGGGIYAKRFASLTISKSTISGNRTTRSTGGNGGGGLFLNGTGGTSVLPVKIASSRIADNRNEAVGTNGGGLLAGGGIALTVTNSTFSGNETGSRGGAVFTSGTGANVVNLTVKGSTFSDNFADQDGGGILANGTGSILITNSKVTGNIARTENGGGLYFTGTPSFHISGGTITGNSAVDGGGIYAYNSTGSILGVTISGNAASAEGGGVLHSGVDGGIGTVTLQIAKVIGNSAPTDPNTSGPFTFV